MRLCAHSRTLLRALSRSRPRERERLVRQLRALAEEADTPRREFIERMPESLGLTS
jgi:hypothetical protein